MRERLNSVKVYLKRKNQQVIILYYILKYLKILRVKKKPAESQTLQKKEKLKLRIKYIFDQNFTK